MNSPMNPAPMNPERWRQIDALLELALDQPTEQRAAFLDTACADDEALRSEVETLLLADAQAENLIEVPVASLAGKAFVQAQAGAMTGHEFGHYKILSPLGAGGMGEVYLAEDTRLRRKVALKLLPARFTSDAERLRRFELEGRAVSALNHPNILTIHEIGQTAPTAGGAYYIITEYIEGQTLRQQLAGGRLTLRAAVEVALQTASALVAAHAAGIVHRDIKPENVMVRPDALVKVLDFGLAKLTEGLPGAGDSTNAASLSIPGRVMGTLRYMSPEQARGLKLDARTDIFSLGVVLYELLTGESPFAGATTADVIAAVLDHEPPPLSSLDAPPALAQIVSKALRKDREQRYQTSQELLSDLKDLQHELAFSTGERAAADKQTATRSSGQVLLGEVKRHKFIAFTALILLALAATAAFLYFNRKPPVLTDKDTILLAEFVNKTGEEVFDGTLRQGLAVQLQQSPFLSLFSDARVRATLRLMNREPDERVTREIGREICQRQGLKALIVGSIAKFDRHYSLTLEALNSQTGDWLALTQVEAESKDQVLQALSRATTELRGKLGESLSSIQKFDAPFERTTSSLEALKAYTLGRADERNAQFRKVIEHMRRAVELDPNFAAAWSGLATQYSNTNQPALAAECATKAFALRDRVSEYEKTRITARYYENVTGELDKAIEAQEAFVKTYPRDTTGPTNLAGLYSKVGQFEQSLAADRESVRMSPNSVLIHGNLIASLLQLSRFAEAKEACARAQSQKLDSFFIRNHLYALAFVSGDTAAMQEQIAWTNGKPAEYQAVDWQTQTAAFAGAWRKSQELARRSAEMAVSKDVHEVGAQYTADEALRAAALGQNKQAVSLAAAALKLARNKNVWLTVALARALAGDAAEAQPLVREMEQQYPQDTLINQLWLPTIKAALELRQGNAQAAIDLLEAAKRYEPAAEFWPPTMRAQAYLKLGKAAEAAAEYQKILDHRGEALRSVLYALAHLGLARAAVLQGDKAKASQSYQDFLALWKDADTDLPLLIEAKKEYEKVK